MKKQINHLVGILFFLSFTISAVAQTNVYVDEDDVVLVEEDSSGAQKAKPVIIMNNQKVEQSLSAQKNKISQQPVVEVKGIPLIKNKATDLMHSRRNAEIQTEQRIVEKLERSRLRDEQERLRRLFGDVAGEQTVVSSESDVVYVDKKNILEDVEEEDQVFLRFHFGQAANLTNRIEKSYGSYGFSLGTDDESGLSVEASFLYSLHEVSRGYSGSWANRGFPVFYNHQLGQYLSPFSDVDQLTGALSLKFTPFKSRLKPYVALVGLYSLWMYDNEDENYLTGYSFCPALSGQSGCNTSRKTTNSIDVGVQAGVDVRFNKKVGVGGSVLVNVRNLYNNNDALFRNHRMIYQGFTYHYNTHYVQNSTLERTNWVIASVNVAVYF